MADWALLLLVALFTACLGGAVVWAPSLKRHADGKESAYDCVDQHPGWPQVTLKELGFACLIPMAMLLLSWSLIVRQLSRAAFWTGGILCVITIVMAFYHSGQRTRDGQK